MKSERILLSLFLPQTKGACIAHLRNSLALTQTQVSTALGLNRTSISKMENGDMNVSEHVWRYVLYLVYDSFNFTNKVTFQEFKDSLEVFIEEDESIRGNIEWKERKSSLQQVTNI